MKEKWKDEAQERLKNIMVSISKINLTPDEIQDEDDFIEGLGLESLDVIQAIAIIEKEFNIQFSDEELTLELFMTFGDLKNALFIKLESNEVC